MKNKTTAYLRRKRKNLINKLPPHDAILRGSLIKRYKRCGKPGCKCAAGRGHGPKYYLSVSQPGSTPRMDYIPLEYQEQVEGYVENFRKTKQLLEEISSINRELLRRRERL